MKKLLAFAALAALSACSKPAPAPEAEATTAAEATSAAAQNIAADGKSSVGMFKVTTHDGKTVMEDVKADGTYVDTVDGKVVETGRWNQKSPSQYCYTSDEKDAVEKCGEEKVENGVWTSKNPKGEVATVVRIEG
ncbi:hypothetical protein [Novosphingobium sp.]|uniref:hypothetical protein n=1 Tax=Novosphingobium sp. TaxID=1874826 RepID=UPI00286A2FEA|nr:hypothetical protein [Novosphingobium sp.]